MSEEWDREVDQLRARIIGCQDCELHASCTSPVPLSLPLRSNSRLSDTGGLQPKYERPTFAVLGEAPGRREDRLQRPFAGPSGKLLRSMMMQSGLDPRAAAYINSVSCWPAGPPSDDSQHLCWKNMVDQIKVTKVKFILATGAVALNALVKGAMSTHCRGGMFVIDWLPTDKPLFVMPTYHPAYVFRDKLARHEIENHMYMFKGVMNGTVPLDWAMNSKCVFCGDSAMLMVSTVPCCTKCKPKLNSNKKRWEKERKYRNKKMQLELEMD